MNFLTGFFIVCLILAALLSGKVIQLICFVLLIAGLDAFIAKRRQSKKRSQTESKNFLPTARPVAPAVIAHAPERIVYLGRNPQVTATVLNHRKVQKRKKQAHQSMLRHAAIRN